MFESPGLAACATVLVVDDARSNLDLISGLLKPLYRVKAANSGERALALLSGGDVPDLILLDVMMPGLSGFEVCRQIKAALHTQHIPIIFLTAMNAVEDERLGLKLGAADYVAKPINPHTLLARVESQLKIKAANDFLRDSRRILSEEVERQTREMTDVQDVTILALASLAETRDNETGNHILRTQHYVKLLAERLQHHPRFRDTLNPHTIQLLFKLAPLHDIGKVGIPDHILLKPGRLTPEEFEIMRTHTTLGCGAIEHAEQRLGREVPFLSLAKEIARSHHETWNGTGYPQGLAGDAIPVSARLMALADVYDALISRRVYKPALPHTEALRLIALGRGTQFDPDVTDVFLAVADEMQAIAQRFEDVEEALDPIAHAAALSS